MPPLYAASMPALYGSIQALELRDIVLVTIEFVCWHVKHDSNSVLIRLIEAVDVDLVAG